MHLINLKQTFNNCNNIFSYNQNSAINVFLEGNLYYVIVIIIYRNLKYSIVIIFFLYVI